MRDRPEGAEWMPLDDPDWTDPRRAYGDPKLRGRLLDGFRAFENDEDLSDCRGDGTHVTEEP